MFQGIYDKTSFWKAMETKNGEIIPSMCWNTNFKLRILKKKKGMIEFKYHHFTTVNKLMDLGNDHQGLLVSQKERTWQYVPPSRNT